MSQGQPGRGGVYLKNPEKNEHVVYWQPIKMVLKLRKTVVANIVKTCFTLKIQDGRPDIL